MNKEQTLTGVIRGTGACVPKRVMDNDEIAGFVETSDEWIRERTGVERRHIAEEATTVFMAVEAGRQAVEEAGVSPEEIEIHLQKIEYVKEVICYGENGRIVGEFYLDEEEYPDAKQRLKADVAEVNKTLADYKQVAIIRTRDEEFPKTTSMKIIRNKNQK